VRNSHIDSRISHIGWQHQRVLNFGETMRGIRERAGLTQEEFGRLIGYSRTAVSRLESSADPRLTPRVLCKISEALNTTTAVLLGGTEDREDPVNRRQLLTAAAGVAVIGATSKADPGRVGDHDVAEIGRGIEDLRLLDQRNGGDRLGFFAKRLVADTERLLRGRFGSTMAMRLQGVLGEASVLAGWLAQDAGDTEAATRFYSDVMAAAHLANDPLLAAHACANLAFLTSKAGQPARAVQCAQAGQRAALEGRAGPRLRALLAAREATGHAEMGDAAAATNSAGRALKAFDSNQGRDPSWALFLSEIELAGILGNVYSQLGQHSTALLHFTQAAQMNGRPRNATSWRLALAQGYVAADDPGQAADLGSQILPDVLTLSSSRIRSQALALSRSLTPHAKVPEVRTFQDLVREAGLAA
jgi:transcriptional regulator with XRE-family HTH domain